MSNYSNNSSILTEKLRQVGDQTGAAKSPELLLITILLVSSECRKQRPHPRGVARMEPGECLPGMGLNLRWGASMLLRKVITLLPFLLVSPWFCLCLASSDYFSFES